MLNLFQHDDFPTFERASFYVLKLFSDDYFLYFVCA